ncbi:FixH family protein [Bacillus paralicheniformis]|uniref:FixH family protein n=1 Tax=Bacillus paralicheniformis TaxID=1648923 RepID=UPI00287D10E0|nr:FixH family protein [Bacillus paralicheniformis]MDR9800850.1 FixH family protein [Bacillus paralicheniformis]
MAFLKKNMFTLFFICSLFLSACSLEQDVADRYKKEKPLESEIILPKSLSAHQKETIKVILTQGGKRVENADFVHFEIWKQDGSVKYPMEQAEEVGKGMYSLTKSFEREGLYYVKMHAKSDGSIIMPQKQFIIGELSESELKFLQKGSQKQKEGHQHHH